MKNKKTLIATGFLIFAFGSCKTPFTPEVEPKFKNVLVVEGFINIGGETTIKLSRTGDLQDWQTNKPEKNVTVIIEGEGGTTISGKTNEDGFCTLPTQLLSLDQKYRTKLISTTGKTYQTDYQETIITPEIDSLNFKIENKGFQIYLNTHGGANHTRYYKWDYNETWEIRSGLVSYLEYKNGKVVNRDPNVNITYCWKTNPSSNILVASTEGFSENRLTAIPVNFINGNSEKIAFTYSISVTQYSLSKEAYQYLKNIKKNTEQIGSIFDAQPSELRGNIYSTENQQEQVLGWISVGTAVEKKLFIRAEDKPIGRDWLHSQNCETFNIPKDSLGYYMGGNHGIVNDIGDGLTLEITGYIIGTNDCIDCRLRGSNVKPAYWPN